ncbi:MAG: nicotinate-nucleotide adenylyltransferase [Candidatus Omnitrophica bacterium]|nr:nicotinate-nucleotide adenylyltransferase [Candidatus Omnitrophota bacterium]
MKQRIGILGGTFNPIHNGHLIIAQLVLEKLGLDKVVFVPSYLPPHKKKAEILSGKDRLKMCQLAVKGHSHFEVSNVEIKRGGKSYTVDTVEWFIGQYPKGTKFYFIIGEDNLSSLLSWKRIQDLLKMVRFVVVSRHTQQRNKSLVKCLTILTPLIEISSSQLRRRIVQGKTIEYFMPKEVVQYIQKNKLYQNG